jgi:excisionase family DNA binding protein
MLALIVLIIGGMMYFTSKFKIGSIQAEGKHVKSAGLILMLPAICSFMLGIILGTLFANNIDLLMSLLNVLFVVEIVGTFLAAFVAYRIIVNPSNVPRLPGILGNLQSQQPPQGKRTVTVPAPMSAAAPPPAPKTTKSVLSTQEAAEYLDMTEANVIQLIEDGKLPAARVNYRYQIARSQLDELLKQREAT